MKFFSRKNNTEKPDNDLAQKKAQSPLDFGTL